MIGLIVARSKNNVIGRNGEIPWKIKGEQKQFRELTTGNVVVMGRKSYEEIGHPLPNRKNIIVSKSKTFTGENLVTVGSLQEALDISRDENVYISGGYGLFKEALPLVDKMYITEVDITVDNGDVFFPEFDGNEFDMIIGEIGGNDIKYRRTIYTRKKQINSKLTESFEKYWPDYQKGEAIFLHKMAVKRKFAGMNVSVVLMDYVKEYAAKLGVKAVCLDCNSKRNRLRTLYEENGFKYVKDMKNEEYILALYCYYVQ